MILVQPPPVQVKSPQEDPDAPQIMEDEIIAPEQAEQQKQAEVAPVRDAEEKKQTLARVSAILLEFC